ncbi:hypothetical protein [Methylobacterium sp. A54F]
MPSRPEIPLLASLVLGILAAGPAGAGSYAFVAAPAIDLNRIYRVETLTGEVTACQYGLREGGGIGQTICFGAGDGAEAQAAGEYGLLASHHTREAGVYRVNHRTGEMSSCYVLTKDEVVVCTAPATAKAGAAADAPVSGPVPGRAGASATPPQGTRP